MDDNAILDLFRERSEDAIVQVQIKYGNYCRSIAYGILSSEEDSEECVNDTYMRAWNSIPPHIPERLSAYLGKITRNLSIDRLRRKGTGKRGGGQFEVALSELEECLPSPSAAGTEEAADSAALSEIINRFLRTLSLEKRTVFIARYWNMRSVSDIASELCTSEAKVKSSLHRLRAGLRAELEMEGYSV